MPPGQTTPQKAPPAIHAAILALMLAISVQIALVLLVARSGVGWGQYLFAAMVFGLLLWGIVRGARLAWLWGRYLTVMLAAMLIGSVVVARVRAPVPLALAAIVVCGVALPLLVVAVALGRRSALGWFSLVCPACGTPARRGKDFFFKQALCGKCRNTW